MKKFPIELTVFSKAGGPLTKRISLAPDGTVRSDGSACLMAQGHACRAGIANMAELGILIEMLKPYQAIALGQLRPDLPDRVEVTTKAKLNGGAGIIARTGQDLVFHQAEHALVLFDHDRKGMPAAVAATLRQHGGFWPALVTVLPALADVARLVRASTSAGLYHGETGAELPGSEGAHVYIVACDGTDGNRFLRALHDRCWLAGMGWYMLGAAGQLLDRSIVDRMVGGPERLVFEGGPLLEEPVRQHCERRKPVVTSGEALDTGGLSAAQHRRDRAACRDQIEGGVRAGGRARARPARLYGPSDQSAGETHRGVRDRGHAHDRAPARGRTVAGYRIAV